MVPFLFWVLGHSHVSKCLGTTISAPTHIARVFLTFPGVHIVHSESLCDKLLCSFIIYLFSAHACVCVRVYVCMCMHVCVRAYLWYEQCIHPCMHL